MEKLTSTVLYGTGTRAQGTVKVSRSRGTVSPDTPMSDLLL